MADQDDQPSRERPPDETREIESPVHADDPPVAAAIDRLTAELRAFRTVLGSGAGAPDKPGADRTRWVPPPPAIPEPSRDPLAAPVSTRNWGRPGPIAIVVALLLVIAGQRAVEKGTALINVSPETEDRLRPTWQNPEPVLTAILLFVAAAGILITSAFYHGRPLPGARALCRHLDGVSIALVAGGLAVFAWVVLSLSSDQYQPSYPRWYLLSLLLIVAGVARRERMVLRAMLPARLTWAHFAEAGAVLILVGIFLFLAMRDVRNWQFVAIGDEHAFFDVTLWFSDGRGPQNLFANEGVYGYHPMLSSYLVAQVMRVAGQDVVGWRLGYNLLVAIGLVFFYMFARSMFNRTVALVALALIVTSHYLLAFAHIGYNNLEPILSTCAALLFFVLATRRSSTTLYLVSGLFAGLGWYTFYSGRITIGVLAVVTLLVVKKRHWFRAGLMIAAGFLLTVLPLVVVSGRQIYERMRIETLATPEGPPRSDVSRLLINTGRSLLAFNYSTVRSHYVTGSLVEPITAALFALGFFLAIVTLRDWRSRILLTWFLIGIAATGIASKYDFVPITRMHYVLPCVVLLAAVALHQTVITASAPVSRQWNRYLIPLALAIVVGISAYLDLRRWYVTSPALAGSSQTSVIWRALTSDTCRSSGEDAILVTYDGDGSLDWVFREHQPDFGLRHVHYDDPVDWIESGAGRCVIFRNPDQPEAADLIARFRNRWPNQVETTVTNSAGSAQVLVFAPAPVEVD